MSDVSVLGIGRMGTALARTLLAAGLDVCVWNRTPARSEPLVRDGARAADSPHEAVQSQRAVGGAAVRLRRGAGRPRQRCRRTASVGGHVLLNLTTGAPEQVAAAPGLPGPGLGYLDGAISGHPEDIGHPASQLLVAGDEAAWRVHRGLVEKFAGETIYVGREITSASALDMAMVGCFQTVTLCAFVEAAAYASAHGVDATVLTPLAERLLGKMRGQVSVLSRAIQSGDYATDQASIAVYVAALEQVTRSMQAVGVPGRLTSAAWENAAAAVAAGRGELGLATQFQDLTAGRDGR